MKRKRGRKPKVLMGVDSHRVHHKDGRTSEKQGVREEKSHSESSEHGELLYTHTHTHTFNRFVLNMQFAAFSSQTTILNKRAWL